MTKAVLILIFSISGFASLNAARPNLVLLLADDCTYRDIACYGSPDAITPHIDQLAKDGLRFTKCYQAAPMCSPTRHNLYNGLYPVKSGAYPNHAKARSDVKSLPHYLQALGYRTGFIGKGHIGPRSVYPFEYLGDKAKGAEHIDLSLSDKFFRECAEKDQPFCLIICSHQPHGPYTLGDRSLFPPDKLTLRKNHVQTDVFREKFSHYLAEIQFLDTQVATVRQQLKDHALDKNSLFLFLSEQGNSFALSKWSCYEDGVKSALIAHWPGVIKPGSETAALTEYNDIVPTFIEAAGGQVPDHLDGTSLLPVFKDPTQPGKKYAFSIQTTRGIIKGSDYFGIRAVTDGTYRYILNLSPENEFSNGDTIVKNKKHWFGSLRHQAKTDPAAAELLQKILTRPPEELYHVENDPDNMVNLANDPALAKTKATLKAALLNWMNDCGDKGLETELLAYQSMHMRNPKAPVITPLLDATTQPSKKTKPTKYQIGTPFTGHLHITRDGYYTFYADRKNPGRTAITINGQNVLSGEKTQSYNIIGLKKGLHPITIAPDKKAKKGKSNVPKYSGPNHFSTPLSEAPLFKN